MLSFLLSSFFFQSLQLFLESFLQITNCFQIIQENCFINCFFYYVLLLHIFRVILYLVNLWWLLKWYCGTRVQSFSVNSRLSPTSLPLPSVHAIIALKTMLLLANKKKLCKLCKLDVERPATSG